MQRLLSKSESGAIDIDGDTMSLLNRLGSDDVVVFGIVGVYRAGKSSLLNLLFPPTNATERFVVGQTTSGQTRGIWLRIVDDVSFEESAPEASAAAPAPVERRGLRRKLLLLDSEGLHDVRGDEQQDEMIFTLMALLSQNELLLNIKGVLDAIILRQLSKAIAYCQSNTNDEGRRGLLRVVVRDALESTTAEAVEQSFAQQRAVNDDLIRANSARVALDALYPRERRRVSLLPRPINDESLLQKVDTLDVNELSPAFRNALATMRDSMLHDARIAPAADGARLTGELFATAVKRWVDALNVGGGKSLSLRQVALEFGTERIAKAVDESIVEYRQRMSQSGDAAISRQDFEFKHETSRKCAEQRLKRILCDIDEKSLSTAEQSLLARIGTSATFERSNQSSQSQESTSTTIVDEFWKRNVKAACKVAQGWLFAELDRRDSIATAIVLNEASDKSLTVANSDTRLESVVRLGLETVLKRHQMLVTKCRELLDCKELLKKLQLRLMDANERATNYSQQCADNERKIVALLAETSSLSKDLVALQQQRVKDYNASSAIAREQLVELASLRLRNNTLMAENNNLKANCANAVDAQQTYVNVANSLRTQLAEANQRLVSSQSTCDALRVANNDLRARAERAEALAESRLRGNARNCNHSYPLCVSGGCSHDCCHR